MRRPRSSPRINLRFATIEEMDRIELLANQEGLDLQNWIRRLIRLEVNNRHFHQMIAFETIKSQFRLEAMVRSVVTDAVVSMAKENAEYRFTRLELQSAQDL